MPYIRCAEQTKYARHLSTPVVSLEEVCGLFNRVGDYTLLDRPYDVLPSLENLGLWGWIWGFERRMRTARRAVIAGCHNIEMLVVHSVHGRR